MWLQRGWVCTAYSARKGLTEISMKLTPSMTLEEQGTEFAKALLDGPAAEEFNPLSLAEAYRQELRRFMEAVAETAGTMAELNAASAVLKEYFIRHKPMAFDPEMVAMAKTGTDAVNAFLAWANRGCAMPEIFPAFAEYIVKSIDANTKYDADSADRLSEAYRQEATDTAIEVIYGDVGMPTEETDSE